MHSSRVEHKWLKVQNDYNYDCFPFNRFSSRCVGCLIRYDHPKMNDLSTSSELLLKWNCSGDESSLAANAFVFANATSHLRYALLVRRTVLRYLCCATFFRHGRWPVTPLDYEYVSSQSASAQSCGASESESTVATTNILCLRTNMRNST